MWAATSLYLGVYPPVRYFLVGESYQKYSNVFLLRVLARQLGMITAVRVGNGVEINYIEAALIVSCILLYKL
jgi:hypothetical protein